MMPSRESVEAVLARLRPYLTADGGDIELVAIHGANAAVRLTGMCAGCPSAPMTLTLGIEAALKRSCADFGRLEVV